MMIFIVYFDTLFIKYPCSLIKNKLLINMESAILVRSNNGDTQKTILRISGYKVKGKKVILFDLMNV